MVLNSKPLQKISWKEKTRKQNEWFKICCDYFISKSQFETTATADARTNKIRSLYEIYNSNYPSSWFKHIIDPWQVKDAGNSAWPAKIRPMNIIRPNIEFLRGEYPKRPFNYQVVVKGEDGYSQFQEAKKNAVYKGLTQIFINTLNEAAQQQAANGEPVVDPQIESQEIPLPQEIIDKFTTSFKNILAVQAQADIDMIYEDQHIKEKLVDMMKDWLIAGEVYSYKNVIRDEVIYERVSPLEISYDKSPHVKYVEDGSWVVRRMLMTVSDIVDRFYDSLKPGDIDALEISSYGLTPSNFRDHLDPYTLFESDKIPVYHTTWKGLKKIGVLSGIDQITGEPYEDIVNEDYEPIVELGETVEWFWVTEWYETYRIGNGTCHSARREEDKVRNSDELDGIYLEMGPVRFQPNMINNLSKSRGVYNGRRFSDTHSSNLSVLKLGLPFQIMYIICNFVLERTIAKSRGKIVLLDQNVIPRSNGWNDEKFFAFSEAQGWGLINRNQVGVDKSFNQYQVLDLGLFDHIANIIEIMEFCKTQYDDQLGISRQSKGKVSVSDTATGTQAAVYQSSIITEMVYHEFDQFVRRELEGLLDASQIANINGKRAAYVSSDDRTLLMNINPEEYSYSQMGIYMSDSTKDNDSLNRIRQYSQAFAQNGAPPSSIVAIETATNIAKLKEILVGIENQQKEIAQREAENERAAQIEQTQLEQEFAEYEKLLDTMKMHEEYNRKEDLVLIQGDINMALQAATEGTAPAESSGERVEMTKAMMDYQNQRDKIALEADRKNKEMQADLELKKRAQTAREKLNFHKQQLEAKRAKKELELREKESAVKRKVALRKPISGKK